MPSFAIVNDRGCTIVTIYKSGVGMPVLEITDPITPSHSRKNSDQCTAAARFMALAMSHPDGLEGAEKWLMTDPVYQ